MTTSNKESNEIHVVGVGSGFKPFYSTTYYSRAYALFVMLLNLGYTRAYLMRITSLDLARRRSEFSSS